VPGLTSVSWLEALFEQWQVLLLLGFAGFRAMCLLGKKLNPTLPGASWCFPLAFALVLTGTFIVWRIEGYSATSVENIVTGAVVSEVSLTCLFFGWNVYVLAAIVVSASGMWLKWTQKRSEEARAAWTTQIGIIVPGLLTLVLNLGIWYAITVVGTSVLELDDTAHSPSKIGVMVIALGDEIVNQQQSFGGDRSPGESQNTVENLRRLIDSMNAVSAATLFPVAAILLLVLLCAGVGFRPAIRIEGTHPFRKDKSKSNRKLSWIYRKLSWICSLFPPVALDVATEKLGRRVKLVFRRLGVLSRLLLPLAIFLMIVVGGFTGIDALRLTVTNDAPVKCQPCSCWLDSLICLIEPDMRLPLKNTETSGPNSAASAASETSEESVLVTDSSTVPEPSQGPFRFLLDIVYYGSWWTSAVIGTGIFLIVTGVLSFVVSPFRAVVDIGNDVANWLRMFPVKGNPTSRIMSRYVSLLN
jgi:hypothetical protein